jgi:beta-1,4-mannosyl-glycoprotein beta-1,4-N-acetylglucosaminyltransferase
MIIDAFTFFNELDLLEFRLKLYEDTVSYHIICESNLTHSGLPKPYYLAQSWERFNKWKNKIIYLQIEQSTEGLHFDKVKSYTPTDGSWILEQQQRSALLLGQDIIYDTDKVLLGDLDEFPEPAAIKAFQLLEPTDITYPIVFSQLFHYYYMNCQNIGYERQWNGTIIATGDQFKELGPQHLRDNRNNYPGIKNGGYHFSYLGGIEKIKEKIQSFAHTEFNREDITSDENIIRSLEKGEDIFKRPNVSYKFVGLDEYPEHIRNLMLEYPQFIKPV